MLLRKEYTCPLELTHDIIKGKWKPIILWRLRLGPTSLSKLEKDIEGINQKMLIEHLKDLVFFELVGKKTFDGLPLRVEYYLTQDRGSKILKALEIMQSVGIDYMIENNMSDILREKGVIF